MTDPVDKYLDKIQDVQKFDKNQFKAFVKTQNIGQYSDQVFADLLTQYTNNNNEHMSNLITQMSNLIISPKYDHKKVLYYELSFVNYYDQIIDLVKSSLKDSTIENNVITYNNKSYKINNEFHVTVLYTGGKADPKAETLREHLSKPFTVSINRIGVNNDFIALGVVLDDKLPYYGNDVQHITFGLTIDKKVFPKDSYQSLTNSTDITPPTIYEIPLSEHKR